MKTVLTAQEVSELLGMHIDTVRRLARQGVLPAHRMPGGRWFKFLTDELIAWLKAQPATSKDDA